MTRGNEHRAKGTDMRRRRRTTDSITAILLAGFAGWALAGRALADHGANSRSATSSGVSNQRGSHGSPAPRQQPPSRLLPPAGLGSAANAPPGFYSRNLSVPEAGPAHHRGPAPAYVPYPYPIYVLPPELAVSPSQVIAPSAQDVQRISAPRYAPPEGGRRMTLPPASQPVIVIQQPAAAPRQPARTPPPPREPAPPPPPRSKEPAAVSFSIAPAEARVYLDDELLGTGTELNGSRQAMMLRPGVHVLEVEHPDYRLQRLVFGVQAEEPMEVAIDLTAERVGRRSRIR